MLKITKISGDTYYITSDEKIESTEIIESKVVEDGKEELYYKGTNVPGVFTFGCKQLTDGVYHKAGYVWSSRTGVINGEFNTRLVYAVICGCGYWSIDVDTLKDLVEEYTGKKYSIEKYYNFYDHGEPEPNYRLVENTDEEDSVDNV
jgi:hypothetical protein